MRKCSRNCTPTGEQRLPTSHPKIIIAKSKPVGFNKLLQSILNLESLAISHPSEIVAELRAIVPEYHAPVTFFYHGAASAASDEDRIAA